MIIRGYTLSYDEERKVMSIYEELKKHFPEVRFDDRKAILGIGEEGSYLMCYFLREEDRTLVKFKYGERLALDNDQAIQDDLQRTVSLFREGVFRMEKRSREIKVHNAIFDNGCLEEYLQNDEYDELLEQIFDHLDRVAPAKLDARAKMILYCRLGIYCQPCTLRAIAALFSISHEYVRKIVKKSIKKLARKNKKTEILAGLEAERQELTDRLTEFGIDRFISLMALSGVNFLLIELICKVYMMCDVDLSDLKHKIKECKKVK